MSSKLAQVFPTFTNPAASREAAGFRRPFMGLARMPGSWHSEPAGALLIGAVIAVEMVVAAAALPA
ncbi:hypothetical protein CEE86_13485, partial [Lactobacillus crispatus]